MTTIPILYSHSSKVHENLLCRRINIQKKNDKGICWNLKTYLTVQTCQRQPLEVFYKKRYSIEKGLSLQRYLKRDSDTYVFLSFLVNFAKFLRTPFLQNTSRWLLLDWALKFSKMDATKWISTYLYRHVQPNHNLVY